MTAWGLLPVLLQQHALQEKNLKDWDFLFLGYSTRSIDSYLDIARLIATEWARAASGKPPFTGAYSKFSLFGHSLGTLGIRQLLCAGCLHPQGMLDHLHSVVLFGTPLNGSPLSGIFAKLFGGPVAEALREGNPQLRMLRNWNESIHCHRPWRGVRVVLGIDDRIVGSKLADLIEFTGDTKPTAILNFNHATLVKPKNWSNSTIANEICGVLG